MSSTSNIAEFIETQARNGVDLWLEQGSLRFKAPQSSMTPALMATLKNRKQEILQWLELQASARPKESANAVDEIEAKFSLSSSQSAIWMLQKFSPRSAVYNTAMMLQLKSAPDAAVMKRFLQLMVARHAMLRTTFHEAEEGAQQYVHNQLPPNFETVNAQDWSVDALDSWLQKEADTGFDLDRESLLRIKLLPDSPKGTLLITTVHHLIADLWSLLLIAQDLQSLMQQYMRGEVLRLPTDGWRYQDHVARQARWLKGAEADATWQYWQGQLKDAPCVLEMPTDFPRPLFMRFEPHKLACVMTPVQSDCLRAFCRQCGITPFVFFQAALQLLVHVYTGQQDFLLGTPTVGRDRPGTETVVGDFANPVVLRACIEWADIPSNWLLKVRESVLEALAHDAMPFPELVQRFNPPRDASRAPLFQIMFLWHQAQIDIGNSAEWQVNMLPESGPRGTPYDLMLSVSDLKTHFEIHWMVPQSLYRKERLEEFSNCFQSLLEELQNGESLSMADLIEKVRERSRLSNVSIAGDEDISIDPVTGFYPTGWGYWQNRPKNLLRWLREKFPELNRDVILLCRRNDVRSSFNCLYLVAADNRLIASLEACEFVDFVVNLPAFPFHEDGSIDLRRLAEIPTVNSREISAISPHITVLHRLQPDQKFQHASVCLPDQTASLTGAPADIHKATIDISDRPMAYQKGLPLEEEECYAGSLLHALQDTAEKFPQRGIRYLDNEGKTESFLSYSGLWRDACRYTGALLQSGIAAGDVVILQVRDRSKYHIVFWSLLRLGAIPLTIANPQQWSAKDAVALKVRNVAQQYAGCCILTDQPVRAINAWVGDHVRVLAMPAMPSEETDIPPLAQENVLAFLQLTSGSTGIPKAIQITHQGILHHIAAVKRFNGYQASDVTLNWLPYDHVVPLLTTHIKDVVLGCEQLQLPTESVLANPSLWIRVMSAWGVTHSWSPNFGFQLVADHWRDKSPQEPSTPERPDLSSVRFLMNAGEQVLASTVNAFMQVCEPFGLSRNAVQPAFGMAECCTCMTYQNNSDIGLAIKADVSSDGQVLQIASDGRHSFVNLGGVVPGVEIRIADSLGMTLREGVIGRLQIRGDVVTPGYLNNTEANREAFVGNGWFNSGDLGFIWQGELYVTGREKEMIVVRGNNYYCYEIEHLSTVEGVKPSFVAAVGINGSDLASVQLVIFYVEDGTRACADIESEITANIQQAYGLSPAFVLPVEETRFYKTTSGKIQRGQFKKQFETGAYQQQTIAFEMRHQRNLLSPAVYNRVMLCESLISPTVRDQRGEIVYMTVSSQRERVLKHPAFKGVCWHTIDCDEKLNLGVNGIPVLSFLAEDAECVMVVPAAIKNCDPYDDGCLDFFRGLARSAHHHGGKNRINLLLLHADETSLMRYKSVVESLGREIGEGRIKLIGIADEVIAHREIKDEVLFRSHDVCVLLQKGKRWVPRLSRYEFLATEKAAIRTLLTDKTFIVTGGSGGLGAALCALLLQQYHCRLILLSRRQQHDAPHEGVFREYETTGRLQWVTMDTQNSQPLQQSLEAALQKWNEQAPAGVFHLAGCMPRVGIAESTLDDWREAGSAKVTLGQTLANWLKITAPKSIFVQYSSLNAFFGGKNAGIYGWANALQSELTEHLNWQSGVRSWSMHWSLWADMGISAHLPEHEIAMANNQGYLSLQCDDAHRLLLALLTQPPGNYYIGIDAENPAASPYLRDEHARSRWVSECVGEPAASAMYFSQLLSQVRRCLPGYQARLGQPIMGFKTLSTSFTRRDNGKIDRQLLADVLSEQFAATGQTPRNGNEVKMLNLWNECLPHRIKFIDENFFDRGGHSISAARLIARINQTFGVQWPVAVLFQRPTVRELAANLHIDADNPLGPILLPAARTLLNTATTKPVLLNANEAAPTTLWMPTLLGDASVYRLLASNFPDACLSWNEGIDIPPLTDIDQYAHYYHEEFIKPQRLQQPITLIGWSFGGTTAFALAQQLYASGIRIAGVIMIDSAIGDAVPFGMLDRKILRSLFIAESLIDSTQVAHLTSQVDHDVDWLAQLKAMLDKSIDSPSLLALTKLFQRFCERLSALNAYRPQGWQPEYFPVTYLKCKGNKLGTDTMGWHSLFSQFDVKMLDMDHHQILHADHVSEMLKEIQGNLLHGVEKGEFHE